MCGTVVDYKCTMMHVRTDWIRLVYILNENQRAIYRRMAQLIKTNVITYIKARFNRK